MSTFCCITAGCGCFCFNAVFTSSVTFSTPLSLFSLMNFNAALIFPCSISLEKTLAASSVLRVFIKPVYVVWTYIQ